MTDISQTVPVGLQYRQFSNSNFAFWRHFRLQIYQCVYGTFSDRAEPESIVLGTGMPFSIDRSRW
jgi:hypothetical protein